MKNSGRVEWRTIFSFNSISLTILGVFFAVLGMQGFMVPNNFIDGGITGLSILITGISNIHISLLLLAFNIPFIIIGYHRIGRTFSMHAFLAVVLLSAGMFFIEIPVFTTDKVLIAVFGGFFIGLGIGLVIRAGGVIDGLEVIAQYTEKKSAFSSGEIILTLNTLVILGTSFKFGIETGMYSILVYYTAMKTTDYVMDGFDEYTSLSIISREADRIKELIVKDMGKAITVYKGERGYLPDSFDIKMGCDIVMTVVTRLEIYRIREAVMLIDPAAFILIHSVKEVKGGLVKRSGGGR
ncbi:MAG: YitT family protein [Cyclobacteriaceae bacterium]|nr:YitT family protein [Cyclobacteriaceae bacterium]